MDVGGLSKRGRGVGKRNDTHFQVSGFGPEFCAGGLHVVVIQEEAYTGCYKHSASMF